MVPVLIRRPLSARQERICKRTPSARRLRSSVPRHPLGRPPGLSMSAAAFGFGGEGDGVALQPIGSGAPSAPRAAPYNIAVYGDSFGQRHQDILGSPNSVDSGAVNPVTFKWPTDLTTRVGSVIWGAASWVSYLSSGKYMTPWFLNRAIGGSNSSQLNQDGGGLSERLSVIKALIAAENAAGRTVHGVVLHVGTNDCVTSFTVTQSYNNIKNICTELAALGCKVVLGVESIEWVQPPDTDGATP